MNYEHKKNWRMILQNKCPICEQALEYKKTGYECSMNAPALKNLKCTFFIKHETYDALIKKMKEESRFTKRVSQHKFSNAKV